MSQSTTASATQADDAGDSYDEDRLRRFFTRKGSESQDWSKDEERSIRRDIVRKWRETGWDSVRSSSSRRRKEQKSRSSTWVGNTFEVGDVLGVMNVLDQATIPPTKPASQASSSATARPEISLKPPENRLSSSTNADTITNGSQYFSVQEASSSLAAVATQHSSTSTTPLLPPQQEITRLPSSRTEGALPLLSESSPRPDINGTRSDGALPKSAAVLRSAVRRKFSSNSSKDKGKGKPKVVQFPTSGNVTEEPAEVSEVLERRGSELQGTSAGVEQEALAALEEQHELQWGDVVMRDRMLFRIARTKYDVTAYHESKQVYINDLREGEWQEYLVIWRKDRLELYEDHSLPLKERWLGYKHLAYVITLRPPTTKLALYSFTDMTLCLTAAPTSIHNKLDGRKSISDEPGTHIYRFKHRSRSRTVDWAWKIWQHLGGEVPAFLDVHCPALGSRVRIDIPWRQSYSGPDWEHLSKPNVIDLCRQTLISLPDYAHLLRAHEEEGKRLELCWKTDTKLDWIWLSKDIDGHSREWAVLQGLAWKSPGVPAELEVRLAEYRSSEALMKDGTHLREPPSIEGYLSRIKPNTQAKVMIYVSIHDGYIFTTRPVHAFPPPPPIPPMLDEAEFEENKPTPLTEHRRGVAQILASDSLLDLRSILSVRRAFQPYVRMTDPNTLPSRLNGVLPEGWSADDAIEATASDNEDEGGDEGLAAASDKSRVNLRRSFECLMKTGHIVRFETHSRALAIQWVTRLRDLIHYWNHRHRVDARQEMEIVYATQGGPRVELPIPSRRDENLPPEGPANPETADPYLSSFWNWSVLDGDRPIVKCGRLFVKRAHRTAYVLNQLVLTSGHLTRFHVQQGNVLSQKAKTISLVDAYVCSGHFASNSISNKIGQDGTHVAKRYQDGLETDDKEEDTYFVIWYVCIEASNTSMLNSVSTKPLPALSRKRKMMLLRGRSMLERDAWCWALNCELERTVRANRERERSADEAGGLPEFA
ncbi:hypothetical protein SISNIDRAFT_415343 [Sistotremastrum niveocremeum HHB9708]|uniref:PH domain-containing protein n=1 Tax=Sistotremastrum niveocremeum HHB9708 TaxID=1314777 RepID=A0A164RGF3_9AGAM|nr:hypothetical protein SISNIDRAFT_415343 [Sistotremastrum niveocremeum HHB9708]